LRKFPKIGERQPNGKLLYSGLECIALKIFAALVVKLAMQAEPAAKFIMDSIPYLEELASNDEVDTGSELTYIVLRNVTESERQIQIMSHEEIEKMIQMPGPDPFTVVPINMKLIKLQVDLYTTSNIISGLLEKAMIAGERDPDSLREIKEAAERNSEILKGIEDLKHL